VLFAGLKEKTTQHGMLLKGILSGAKSP